ncbi:MAG: trypsin-like peptidase domain-containing protein [Dehalococcoidales bacterium]|nr:trypsin-like peptidase domain-containing protein [Dehalococcoidales bacterium]
MKRLRNILMAVLAVLVIGGAAYAGGATLAPNSASATPVLYSEDAVTAIYDNASPAVVSIKTTEQGNGFFGGGMGEGTGFLIDAQGHILTNNHVVDGATTVQIVLDDGKTIDAKVVGTDPMDDLAVIKVDATQITGITPLELADSSTVKPGQLAIAMGNPLGLDDSITVGVISGLNRNLSGSSMTGMLQTDAAINPGNSGGPLLNSAGKVIGINTAIETSGGARGIGFAVPSNVATRVLPQLIAGQKVTRPWLGISGLALNTATAQTLGLSVDKGIYVVTVVADSPAAKAGLKAASAGTGNTPGTGGDVITAADGKAVSTVEELSSYLATRKVGDVVALTVLRNGQTTTIQATLEAWPDRIQTVTPNIPQPQPRIPNPWGGRNRSSDE